MSAPDLRTVPVDAAGDPLAALVSPESLDALFGGLTDGVTVQSAAGLVYANDAAARAMGFASRHDLLGADGAQLASGFEIRDAFGAPVSPHDLPGRLVLAQGRPQERVLRFSRRGAGEERWAVVKASPLRDASGRALLALNVVQDVTERRRAEARLRAQHAVTSLLAEADPADDALPRALSALAEAMGWDFAALWLREGDELRCEATWRSAHAPVAAFDQATRETRLARGEGLPSRVLAEGGPEWSLDFAADARNPRAGAAREAGLHGAVAFPMRTGGRVVGVLELLGRDARAPDEPLVRALETIGGQMGLFLERAAALAATRESLARRSAILDSALDCIVTMDAGGKVVEWNAAAERALGWPREEALGRDMADLIVPPGMRERHRQGVARYLAGGEPRVLGQRLELPALRRDGSVFPAELAIVRVPGAGPPLFTGFLRDLTAQKAAEEARRDVEARLTQFYERSPVALFAATPSGRFLEANPAFAHLLGHSDVASLLARPVAAVHADPARRAEMRAVLERDGVARGFETEFTRADGARVSVSVTARAVRDAAGAVARYEGMVEDVTARKRAEEDLRLQKVLLEAQMESVLDAILVVGLDGRVLSWNRAFTEVWGIPPDLVEARDVEAWRAVALGRVKDRDAFLAGTRYYAERSGEVCRDEVELLDGRVLDRYGAPVRMPDGTLVGRIWSYRDVTQRRRQEAVLEATLEAVQDGILIVGDDGRAATRNAQLARAWGLSEDAIESMPAEGVLASLAAQTEDSAAFVAGIEAMRADARPARDEVRLKDRRVLERFGAPVRGRDGLVHGRVWTFRDITQAKESEERLRGLVAQLSAQRARLDAIVRSVPGVVWEAWGEPDAATQRIDFVSDHVERLLGYTAQEWLSTPNFWLTIVHPDDREAAAAEARAKFEGRKTAPQEFRWIAKDGRALWVQAHSTPILDGAGRPVGMRGVTLDVSDRKRAEEAIRESEARWRFLANALPEQVWTASPDGRLDYASQQACRYSGRPEEEIVGDGWTSLVHPEDLPQALARWSRSLETGEPYEAEHRLRRADGAWRWHLARAIARRDPAGRVEKWYGAYADVQDLKDGELALKERAAQLTRLAAQLERSNRELDQFAYVTSHDLKAPLRGIANLSRWIEEDLKGEVPPEVRAHLDLLRGRVARMEALIGAILEYSRVGRTKAVPEPVDTGKLVEEIVDLLSPPQGFRVEVAPGMPTLPAERLRLHQVFLNLIGNAIKHHHRKDSGRVRVSAEDAGDRWLFRVEDDGPGIAPRYHEKVFVIFQTLEARDKVEGTGIGLALVKKIVEAAGGSIRLDSDEGRGAAFTFSWPKASQGS